VPETKKDYQILTAWVHLALAVISLLVCIPALFGSNIPAWISLVLGTITNGLIAWAKFDVVRTGAEK
jgi:hypothetical protein